MNMPIISVSDLTKTYGRRRKQVTAVNGVNLEVWPGEIFGLVGPDGVGKTTTIQMLCGLLASSSGGATVAGIDVVRDGGRLGGQIGYMSEGFTLYRPRVLFLDEPTTAVDPASRQDFWTRGLRSSSAPPVWMRWSAFSAINSGLLFTKSAAVPPIKLSVAGFVQVLMRLSAFFAID
jgi:ABC-type multidrug transport system ATPase subunit